jgi:hypothetical protein
LWILTCSYSSTYSQEKKSLIINLSYHRLNNDLPVLVADAKTKNGRRWEPVEGAYINFFINQEDADGYLGRVKTNTHGNGSLRLPEKVKSIFEEQNPTTFIATSTSNSEYEDSQSEIEIYKAKIALEISEEDSVKEMKATLLVFEDSVWNAVPETEVKFVVKRTLKDFPASEEDSYTTDENGDAIANFELRIPGDEDGNILIGAKIEDNDMYGNLIVTQNVKWGVASQQDNSFSKRTLWATRSKTPYWLLIFPNMIIAGVWGSIIYLIYLIIKIKKESKTQSQ